MYSCLYTNCDPRVTVFGPGTGPSGPGLPDRHGGPATFQRFRARPPTPQQDRTAGQGREPRRQAGPGPVLTLSLTWAGRPCEAGRGAGRGLTPPVFGGGWPRWLLSRRPQLPPSATRPTSNRQPSAKGGRPAASFSWRDGRPHLSPSRPQRARSSPIQPFQPPAQTSEPGRLLARRAAGASVFRARRGPSPFGATGQRRGFPLPLRDQLLSSRAVVPLVFQAASIQPGARRGRRPSLPRLSPSALLLVRGAAVSRCGWGGVITVTGL